MASCDLPKGKKDGVCIIGEGIILLEFTFIEVFLVVFSFSFLEVQTVMSL